MGLSFSLGERKDALARLPPGGSLNDAVNVHDAAVAEDPDDIYVAVD